MRASCLFLLLCLATPVFADDTSAGITAGGIQFKQTDHILMASEDLFISPSIIRVKFEFKNLTDQDYHTIVAFPLPSYQPQNQTQSDVGVNFDGAIAEQLGKSFVLKINGQKKKSQEEIKAFNNKGEDVTNLLKKYDINIVNGIKAENQIKTLSDTAIEELKNKGIYELLHFESEGDWHDLKWEVRHIFYWDQVFPAGKVTRIEHEYQPMPTSSYATYLGTDSVKDFCIDPQAKDNLIAYNQKRYNEETGKILENSTDGISFGYQDIGYILKTGNNWAGPIKKFHLTIEIGENDLAAFACFEGLKQTSARHLEAELRDFTPTHDLRVLFINNQLFTSE